MGWGRKLKHWANPVRATKSVVNKVTGRDARQEAEEAARRQEAELETQKRRQQELLDQQQRKNNGNDADQSGLAGLGEDAGGGIDSGLTGLGGVDPDELKLQKKKLLGA